MPTFATQCGSVRSFDDGAHIQPQCFGGGFVAAQTILEVPQREQGLKQKQPLQFWAEEAGYCACATVFARVAYGFLRRRAKAAKPANPLPKVTRVSGSGIAAPLYVIVPRIRLASGLAGELIGVEGSRVKLKVPAVGELKFSVVEDQTTDAPDAPELIVPVSVAV